MRLGKIQSQILTFVTHQLEPVVSIQPLLESESLDEGGRGITQGMIRGGTSIVKDVFAVVLTYSSKMIFIDHLES